MSSEGCVFSVHPYDLVAPNHTMHTRITISMPQELELRLAAAKPKYQSLSGFYCELLDKGLTGGLDYAPTVSVRETGQTHPVDQPCSAVQSVQEKISPPHVGPFLGDGVGNGEPEGKTPRKHLSFSREIPDALEPFAELIEEFWRIKKGSKSSNAWSMLITELEKINASFGKDRTTEQLELAINGLWKGITMRNMQRFELPKGKGEPEHKHPAYRDAADVIAESERLAQQNVEHLRRKEEERNTDGGVLSSLF